MEMYDKANVNFEKKPKNECREKNCYILIIFMSVFLMTSLLLGSEPHQAHKHYDCNDISQDLLMSLYCKMSKSMTEPNAVKIEFYAYKSQNDKKERTYSGAIWFAKGRLFVKQHDANETYNIATINNNVYEWHSNKAKGTIYKRYEGDTLDFLHHFIDPVFFKLFSYKYYLEDPNDYIVTENNGIKKIVGKNPLYEVYGIEVLEEPFWLYSTIFHDPEKPGIFTTLVFERPQPIDKIPDDIQKLPNSVTFEKSKKTLEVHFGYL